MPVTITTRVDDDIVKRIDAIAKEEAGDRSTAIRKLLPKGGKEWMVPKSIMG